MSRFGGEFWDAVSDWNLFGKLWDGILLYCGSHFPRHASTGKRVPEFGLGMGWSFRLLAKRPPELLLWRPFSQLQMNVLVVLGQALDVVGDHVFLVGGDDHDRDGRSGGADDLWTVAHGLAVLVVVDAHAQPLKAVAEGLADRPVVLADAGSKGNGVHARHGGDHGTGLLHGLVGEHVEGEQAALVTLGGARADVAGVVGDTRDGKQTGLLVHHVVDFLIAVAALALQVTHGGWVDGTATGTHHQTVERRETHRGIAADAVLDSGKRGTVAQVAR